MPLKKYTTRKRRHGRTLKKIETSKNAKPRLLVYRSIKSTYAQMIDDKQNKVLFSVSDLKDKSKGTKSEKAKKVGTEIAKKAVEHKIIEIAFDRNGYKYHGRVKAVAEGAREGGLKF